MVGVSHYFNYSSKGKDDKTNVDTQYLICGIFFFCSEADGNVRPGRALGNIILITTDRRVLYDYDGSA